MERTRVWRWTCLLTLALGLTVAAGRAEAEVKATALTRAELDSYRDLLDRIVDEVALDLPHGALKGKALGKEEKERMLSATARKVMGAAQSGNFRAVLEHFEAMYGKIFHALLLSADGEMRRYPRELEEWHLKLAMGFKDCRRVTADALAEVVRSGKNDLVMTDSVGQGVGLNAGYFHVLQRDLEALVGRVLADEAEVAGYVRGMRPVWMYIEQTWK